MGLAGSIGAVHAVIAAAVVAAGLYVLRGDRKIRGRRTRGGGDGNSARMAKVTIDRGGSTVSEFKINSRRNLLKALTVGGGAVTVTRLPATWSKPAVETVMLPAHAQTTSGAALSGSRSIDIEVITGLLDRGFEGFAGVGQRGSSPLDSLFPPAHAGVPEIDASAKLFSYVEALGAGLFLVQVLLRVRVEDFRNRLGTLESGENSLMDAMIGEAHAGSPVLSPCFVEIKWHAELQTQPLDDGSGRHKSDTAIRSASDYCGVFSFPEGSKVGLTVQTDSATNPTTAQVWVENPVQDGQTYKLENTPGGGKLSVDCSGNPCPEVFPSDRAIKSDFSTADEVEILDKVARMPIGYWRYSGERDAGARHIGPMAQDFHEAFQLGDSDRHIHAVDANGVNMAAIKALYRLVEEKDARIAALEEEIRSIRDMVSRNG